MSRLGPKVRGCSVDDDRPEDGAGSRTEAGVRDGQPVFDDEVEVWQQMVDSLPQIVWVTRPDGWHVYFNRQWYEYTGLSFEESVGHGWNPPFHPDDRPRARRLWSQATSSGQSYEIEYRLRRHDGVYRWMLGRAAPLRDPAGEVVQWMGTCTDIDELKHVQDELEVSRDLHRLAGTVARLGGFIYRTDDGTMTWSDELYDVFELSPDVAPDLDDTIALALPDDQQLFRDALAACVAEGKSFDIELEGDTYRGRYLWVRIIAEPRPDGHGTVTGVQGAVQDITAHKEAERRSRMLADRLTTTLESITDAFWTVDENWTLTYVNQRAEQLLQRDCDELLGTQLWAAFPQAVHTILYDRYRSAMQSGASDVIEEFYWPPIGRWLDIHIYPSEHGLAVYFRDVTDTLEVRHSLHERLKELQALATINASTNRIADVEELCQLAADNLATAMQQPDTTRVTVRLEEVTCYAGAGDECAHRIEVPIDIDGGRRGLVAVSSQVPPHPQAHDLVHAVAETLGLWGSRHRATARLNRLNERLNDANERLVDAVRLKEDLLSMASHELRTPLTPILGFSETLETRGDDLSGAQQQMVGSIRDNARRMSRLVEDLLVVSQSSADALVNRPDLIDLPRLLAEVIDDLGGQAGKPHISVEGCRVYADPNHLTQILTNLLSNAAKYGRPPITVEARTVGDRTLIDVADHGPGIDPEFQQRMWDRFEQKDRGDTRTASGVGLGLTITRLLAETCGGNIRYGNRTPTGAIFTIELPAIVPAGIGPNG